MQREWRGGDLVLQEMKMLGIESLVCGNGAKERYGVWFRRNMLGAQGQRMVWITLRRDVVRKPGLEDGSGRKERLANEEGNAIGALLAARRRIFPSCL